MHPRVFGTLHSTSQEELNSLYEDWASDYDKDVVDLIGYQGHSIATNLLLQYLKDKNSLIFDAGCGTGLVGEELCSRGFENIVGIDYSQPMLDEAAQKNIYQSLELIDLNQVLPYSSNTYDAAICAGTFTCGHVGPNALNELVRVTKPGGYISFTVREQEWVAAPYEDTINELIASNKWQRISQSFTDYNLKEGVGCQLCLYQVTS